MPSNTEWTHRALSQDPTQTSKFGGVASLCILVVTYKVYLSRKF